MHPLSDLLASSGERPELPRVEQGAQLPGAQQGQLESRLSGGKPILGGKPVRAAAEVAKVRHGAVDQEIKDILEIRPAAVPRRKADMCSRASRRS